MAKKDQHVVPSERGWSVKNVGSSRVSRTFATQTAAIKVATQIAKKEGTNLYIHGKDGRIRDQNSYGKDRVRDQRSGGKDRLSSKS